LCSALDLILKQNEKTMGTIEQEIEQLAKLRWPSARRIDIGSALSHQWHGDIEPATSGYSMLVSNQFGKSIKRLQAESLEELKAKVSTIEA
jgi:hypothetical protein